MSAPEPFDFDFGHDPLKIYPFRARCIAAAFPADRHGHLLDMGRNTLDYAFGRRREPSRHIRAGHVFLYFPERWLAAAEVGRLMQRMVEIHAIHPLAEVLVVTGSPVILTDFAADMVRVMGGAQGSGDD